MASYLPAIIPVLIEELHYQKVNLDGENIICYMHGYEYNIFDGRLIKMKSWKKKSSWTEQNPEWRKSGQLILYNILENEKGVFIDVLPNS